MALAAFIALALLASVVAVVAVTSERKDPYVPFDIAGKRVDTAVDPLDPMTRPKGAKGVELDEPKPPKETTPEKPAVKPKKECDKDSGADKLAPVSGLPDLTAAGGKGDEVCAYAETSQSDDLVNAEPLTVAEGTTAVPAPKPAPEEVDPSEDPSGSPSTDPSGNPPTDVPVPSDDESGPPADGPSEGTSEESEDDSDGLSGEGAAPRAKPAMSTVRSAPVPAAIDLSQGALAPAGEYLAPNWIHALPATSPSKRRSMSMVYDVKRNQYVLFGGRTGATTFSNETWLWNGVNWTKATPTTSPSARSRAAMAWDPVLERVVMFGGQTSSGADVSDEVWTWNGTTWALQSPTGTKPIARAGATMAYDNSRAGMIVFGGVNALGAYSDTWMLKNNAWTRIQASSAPGAPPGRYDSGMAYSASTGEMILFGGGTGTCSPTCAVLSDTWTLQSGASTWTHEAPGHNPPARGGQGMAYDASLGVNSSNPGAVVMFGGIDYTPTSLFRNDTWAWTGNDWAQAVGSASPSGRAAMAMAADNDGHMVLFGGQDDWDNFSETWTYDTNVPILGIEAELGTDEEREDDTLWVGDSIRVRVTAANPGQAITASDQISITSALQSTLLAAGTQIKWGTAEVSGCQGGLAALCGGVQDLTATIANIGIPAGGTTVGEFIASVAGSQKGCELIDIPAVASSLLGATAEVSTQVTVCGGGLGLEDWWTFDTTDLDGGGSASVNVANGNLVVKQYDTDPVQMPGRLAMGLGRVYNSQDHMSGGGPIGAGWQFDIGDTGETAGGFGLFGLSLPNLQTVLQPLSMPYVDRDGTRHVFKLRSLGASVGGLSLPIDLNSPDAGPILDLLNPATLPFTLTSIEEGLIYGKLCIDQAYTGPPGSNMFLFRYIGTGASGCAAATEENKLLSIGWSLVRPDRVRYDFDLLGNLVRVTDPAGEQLTYTPGVQYGPTEIRSSSCASGAACPKITINYNAGGAGSNRHVKVTDTAGRVTSYIVSPSLTLPLLLQVWEPGNPLSSDDRAVPTAAYTYATANNPCSVGGPVTAGQLCSVTNANGEKTTFSYVEAPMGPDRIEMVKDRRANASDGLTSGLATKYTWSDPVGDQNAGIYLATADMAAPNTLTSCGTSCHRIRYSNIDRWGRVGQIAEGTTGGTDNLGIYSSQAGYLWDGMGDSGGVASCAQPTLAMNHNLCQVIRRAVPSSAAFTPGAVGTGTVSGTPVHDQAVDYLYGDFGQRLRQRVLLDASQAWTDANSAITTWGSHEQYFDANKNQRFFNNHVRGNGVVKATAAGGTYRQSVMQDAPLSYWRLNEPSGTAMASETGTNNGVYGSTAALGQPGVVHGNTALGESTSAWSASVYPLTGFAQGTTATDSDFTVETWMKTASTGLEYALQWGSGTAYATVGRLNGGLPFVGLYSDSATNKGAVVYSTTSVSDNEWHHVVYRYTGSGNAAGIEIWIDGQQAPTTVYSNTLAGAFAGASPIGFFGASSGTSSLDELAIYNTALAPSRIQAHHTAARGATRIKADTLYAVVDEVQELSPRGNAAANSNAWGEYLTSIRRDIPADGVLASTNKTAGDSVCGSAPRGNTGLVCEVDTPAAAGVARGVCTSPTSNLPAGSTLAPTPSGSYASTCTTYEYNNRGQRSLMRSPKANSGSSTGDLKPGTEYRYYPVVTTCSGDDRKACDLSGSVSAGGWLKAVIDPAGEKVVYAYDAAGNIARTWDRNASHGKELTAGWADANAPPSNAFTDTVSANPITSDAISVSNTALIAISPDGTVTGAGTNASGELGDSTTTPHSTAVRADPMTNVVQVAQSSTGAFSGCAFTLYLTGSGKVWAAGQGTSRPYPASGLPDNIISVAAGGCHGLALDADGGLWAWGTNNAGQIGNGTTAAVYTPVKVLEKVSTMAAGYTHTLAVTTDGKTWAWGANNAGQLGLGDTSNRTTPTQAAALDNAGIRQLSGGFASSYAVGRDGTVWAFGNNGYSDLGDGTTTQRTSPVKITTLGPGTSAGPVRQVVGAAYGATALMADGTVRVWGLNNVGQSGGGSTAATMTTPTQVPDLTGQVAIAGGWATIATADQAGRIKVWGGTANHQLANGTNPTSTTTPTLAGINISPYKTALWGPQGSRDATGNLSTTTRDRLGQPRRVRAGRGHDINTSAFDRMTGYDAAGRPVWASGAQHRAPSNTARTTYDPFGNPIKSVDARGVASRATFDALNRQVSAQVTRGIAADSPASCTGTATTADWTSGQSGHKICITTATYDGISRQVTGTDANSQVTTLYFDAAGRRLRIDTPRNHAGATTLATRWNYDRDGRVIDTCPPRQFSSSEPDNTTTCTSSGVHSTHLAYDTAGNVKSETRYRAGSGQPEALVTAYQYDADRNVISMTDANGHETTSTFDLQGRRLTKTVPRTATRSYTSRWSYDPAGNITAVRAPGSINTGSGADGHLVIDGTTAANSTDGTAHGAGNPFQIPDGAQYRNVTLQNGAYATSAVANGLMLHATGTVTVCSTCVVTMAGKGYQGGAAGTGANNGNGSDAANPNPGNGGKGGAGGLLGLDPSGGGGGGHKTDGGQPGTAGSGPGLPGKATGSPDFATVGTDYLRGSGGGGGGGGKNLLGTAGPGGNGGGFVRITANKIVISGQIDASGADGGAGAANSGGGGGGAGGGIWLAAPDIDLAATTALDVTGGTGGAGPTNRQGGNGSAGYVRLDADAVTNEPSGADRTRAAMITSISYDAANRPVDTVEGAQTLQADPTIDAGEFAVPDPNGLANTRSRSVYDADGQIVATLPPQAFGNAASLTAPNNDTARRVDYNLDGLPVASYNPRYDNASGSATTSIGSGNDGGGSANQQTSQCATGRVVDQAAGPANNATGTQATYRANYSLLPANYGSQVGVCITRTTYDPIGNLQRAWLPTSNGTDNGYLEYAYTGDALTATITGPDPNSTGRVTVSTSRYDGVGRETWNQDANNNITQTAYTADGLVRQTAEQAYDPDGSGPAGTVTEISDFEYDAGGNLLKRSNPSIALDVTLQTWTTDNLIAQITAPGPGTGTGQTTAVTKYGYDLVGNAIQTWQPEAVLNNKRPVRNEFTYDNLLAATHTPITDTSYRSARYAYSPAGMKVATETARCSSATYTDCAPGNSNFLTAGVVKLTYGANGRPTSQVGRDRDPLEGPTTSITTTYSQHGGPAKIIDPTSGITIEAGYYLDGMTRRVTETGAGLDSKGNTNTYAYNGSGAVTVRTDKTGVSGATSDATATTSYRYNHAGLPGGVNSDVLDAATDYTWDDAGRILTAQTGAHIAEWSWHPNDALAGAKTTVNATVMGEYRYQYNSNRNITKQTVTGSDGNYTNDYSYSPGQQVTGWTYAPTGGTQQATTYGWDKNSNRKSVAVNVSGTTTTTNTTYNQDNSIATVDAPGTASDYSYEYNRAGLLINDGCSTYVYDAFDRIDKQIANNTAACGTNGRTTEYTYDGMDRQRAIKVTGSSKAGANRTTRSVYDGLGTEMVGQTDAVNGDLNGPKVLYQFDASSTPMAYEQSGSTGAGKAYLDHDGNGNITTVTTTGYNLACSARFDPFGSPVDAASGGDANGVCHNTGGAAEATGNASWYRGQTRDGSTGNYQLGARTYSPTTGAFTAPDSYRVSDSGTDLGVGTDPLTMNTYSYVNGNPINLLDPDGHAPTCVREGTCTAKVDAKGRFTKIKKTKAAKRADSMVAPPTGLELAELLGPGIERQINSTLGSAFDEEQFYDDYIRALKAEDWDALGQFDTILAEESCINDGGGKECLGLSTCTLKCIPDNLKTLGKVLDPTAPFRGCIESGDRSDCIAAGVSVVLAGSGGVLARILRSRRVAKSACDVPSNSFTADTPVLMADGSKKLIKDVELGDFVFAVEPETGENGPRKVVDLIRHSGPHLMVRVRLADGTAIDATDHHPFWVESDHTWVEAIDLESGDVLIGPDGAKNRVIATLVTEQDLTAYNLTIEDLHTYFAGAEPVLVHNDDDDYNQAMREAMTWLEERGFRAERPTFGRFGDTRGRPIGMQTADGKVGFRVEFDERSGAHINVFNGKEKGPHFTFNATSKTVSKIQGNFGC
ncbi:polymorphic toxin-type HINT domain-containing protein [Nocardioides sp. WS12]|uniref:RCC1 domain-containing protein n=1 Tax=Nocardioides sp. WS12 TaxID=2486272 RepID=UPI0015F869D2|nr:polymorphic toxin-type HINT domain-containing protein [Nocardioides sp. WS12]